MLFFVIKLKTIIKIIFIGIGMFILLIALFLLPIIVNFFKYSELIYRYSIKNSLEPSFVAAIIEKESKFDNTAVSYKGASGLMQLTENTAIWLSELMPLEKFDYSNIFSPEINIKIGTYYLNRLSNNYNGNKEFILIAYNAGSGNLAKWRNDKNYSVDGSSLHYIPFKETRDYVDRINKSEKKYKIIFKLLGEVYD